MSRSRYIAASSRRSPSDFTVVAAELGPVAGYFAPIAADLAIVMAKLGAVLADLAPGAAEIAVVVAGIGAVVSDLAPVAAKLAVSLAEIARARIACLGHAIGTPIAACIAAAVGSCPGARVCRYSERPVPFRSPYRGVFASCVC